MTHVVSLVHEPKHRGGPPVIDVLDHPLREKPDGAWRGIGGYLEPTRFDGCIRLLQPVRPILHDRGPMGQSNE